jgi:hypothetical protein
MPCNCGAKYRKTHVEDIRVLAQKLAKAEKAAYVLVSCAGGSRDVMPLETYRRSEGYTALEYFLPL